MTQGARDVMHVEIIQASDDRWADSLRTMPHDFSALPGYVTLAARFEGGEPVAILAEDGDRRLILPLLLRAIPKAGRSQGWRDAVSPYGYPGIGLSPDDPDDPDPTAFLDEAMTAAIALLREHQVVSLFVRLNPLLPVDAGVLARHGLVVDHGHTVSIDLLRSEEELVGQISHGHSKNLRRLDRRGFTCEVDEVCTPESISTFVEIYTETMDRVGASESYYFDETYLSDLVTALEGRAAIVSVRQGDEVAAVGLFTQIDGIVQDHIGGTRSAFTSVAPSKLKIREATKWAKARGHRIMHLGGGLGGSEDALFAFKAGFSPDRHLFQTVRIVVDEPAYDELTTRWEAEAGMPAGDRSGFFPAYRARTLDPAPSPGGKASG